MGGLKFVQCNVNSWLFRQARDVRLQNLPGRVPLLGLAGKREKLVRVIDRKLEKMARYIDYHKKVEDIRSDVIILYVGYGPHSTFCE